MRMLRKVAHTAIVENNDPCEEVQSICLNT